MPRIEVSGPEFNNNLVKGIYSFRLGIYEYDFIYNPSTENRLFVLLSGYADRKKYSPPVFQRWSWAEKFPGHCLCISDPTIKLKDDLGLGWYLGTKDNDEILGVIKNLILNISTKLGISSRNIILYASSGGGFAVLKLSELLPDSLVITINPQIDITKYPHSNVTKVLNYFYEGISKEQALAKYQGKFNVVQNIEKIINNRIVYVQNKLDEHHFDVHSKLFADAVGLNDNNSFRMRNIEVVFFEHPDGHRKAETPEVFELLMEKVIEYTR